MARSAEAVEPRYICPKEKPRCTDYVMNEKWGTCVSGELQKSNIPNCGPIMKDTRYRLFGGLSGTETLDLPGIKYNSKATMGACFKKCGEVAACKQAVYYEHGGLCLPMKKATIQTRGGQAGQNKGYASIHCNKGTRAAATAATPAATAASAKVMNELAFIDEGHADANSVGYGGGAKAKHKKSSKWW
jgi:hypothetical protein